MLLHLSLLKYVKIIPRFFAAAWLRSHAIYSWTILRLCCLSGVHSACTAWAFPVGIVRVIGFSELAPYGPVSSGLHTTQRTQVQGCSGQVVKRSCWCIQHASSIYTVKVALLQNTLYTCGEYMNMYSPCWQERLLAQHTLQSYGTGLPCSLLLPDLAPAGVAFYNSCLLHISHATRLPQDLPWQPTTAYAAAAPPSSAASTWKVLATAALSHIRPSWVVAHTELISYMKAHIALHPPPRRDGVQTGVRRGKCMEPHFGAVHRAIENMAWDAAPLFMHHEQ